MKPRGPFFEKWKQYARYRERTGRMRSNSESTVIVREIKKIRPAPGGNLEYDYRQKWTTRSPDSLLRINHNYNQIRKKN